MYLSPTEQDRLQVFCAAELARRLQPDVVLMDLAMPNVDGLAATKLISAEMPGVKVVVLTASDEDAKA